jgi:hypothetical protein
MAGWNNLIPRLGELVEQFRRDVGHSHTVDPDARFVDKNPVACDGDHP